MYVSPRLKSSSSPPESTGMAARNPTLSKVKEDIFLDKYVRLISRHSHPTVPVDVRRLAVPVGLQTRPNRLRQNTSHR